MKQSIFFLLLIGIFMICTSCSKEEVVTPKKELSYEGVEADNGGLVRCDGTLRLANLDSPFEIADDHIQVRAVYNLDKLGFDISIKNTQTIDLCDIKIELVMKYGLILVNEIVSPSVSVDHKSSFEFFLPDGGIIATGFRVGILTKRTC